ncbi:small subunit ribosomal protein S23 [Geosmithia morbida]|uniref:37S ribosomal protein S25, mitochondrial n=1 Tax=Geosmithia morbida TaxID=1094350 RepID=A0A9P4YN51_9HYPO|nr:small subunit ribosomal protein S23 [Geosmithia morbida]KAF4119517.1 small subunit ribosomal protein S23 [Geosmithia morbida]
MGGKQIRPATVWKTKTEELRNHLFNNRKVATPPWYEILSSCPPAETLVRTVPVRHHQAAPKKKAAKPRNLYRPQPISYPEDKLRRVFYKDHPWELARPRVLVESDGKDYQFIDWSRGLRQPGIPLSGESVVQRQLWRMENENMSRQQAYDVTRREFYRLRQEEEVEKRIAKEEAQHVGAYFGKSRLEVGMLLEDSEYENWKVWAGKEAQKREMTLAAQNDEAEEAPRPVEELVQ